MFYLLEASKLRVCSVRCKWHGQFGVETLIGSARPLSSLGRSLVARYAGYLHHSAGYLVLKDSNSLDGITSLKSYRDPKSMVGKSSGLGSVPGNIVLMLLPLVLLYPLFLFHLLFPLEGVGV